jgi:hypothetical protein
VGVLSMALVHASECFYFIDSTVGLRLAWPRGEVCGGSL